LRVAFATNPRASAMTPEASSAVIEFPSHRVRPAAPREPGQSSAQVVIFSGVRIERLTSDPQAARKGRRQRR
jgi:hypothetical protein